MDSLFPVSSGGFVDEFDGGLEGGAGSLGSLGSVGTLTDSSGFDSDVFGGSGITGRLLEDASPCEPDSVAGVTIVVPESEELPVAEEAEEDAEDVETAAAGGCAGRETPGFSSRD